MTTTLNIRTPQQVRADRRHRREAARRSSGTYATDSSAQTVIVRRRA